MKAISAAWIKWNLEDNFIHLASQIHLLIAVPITSVQIKQSKLLTESGNCFNLKELEVLKKNQTTPMIKVDNNGTVEINNIKDLNNDDEKKRAEKIGIKDLEKKYNLNELAHGDIIFSATGVTEGTMVRGVRSDSSHYITHSLVLRTGEAASQYIETYHKKD